MAVWQHGQALGGSQLITISGSSLSLLGKRPYTHYIKHTPTESFSLSAALGSWPLRDTFYI